MDWRNKPNQIFNKVKQQMFAKGIETFHFLDQHITAFDPEAIFRLSSHQFNILLNKAGVFLTTQEIRNVLDLYSKGTEDEILYKNFLEDVKYSVSQNIAALISRAFELLDNEGKRAISLNKVIEAYNANQHPHVLTRHKEPVYVKQEFINAISRKAKDGQISKEGFVDYYAELNFCIPRQRENFFEEVITGTWGIANSADYVAPKRIQQLEAILYEKIRQKSDGKSNEWKTAKRAMSFFDLGDKGSCDFTQFKRGLDKFGCNFKEHEARALFNKYDLNQNQHLEYEQFSKMIMDLDISGMSKQLNLLTTLGTNHFKVTH